MGMFSRLDNCSTNNRPRKRSHHATNAPSLSQPRPICVDLSSDSENDVEYLGTRAAELNSQNTVQEPRDHQPLQDRQTIPNHQPIRSHQTIQAVYPVVPSLSSVLKQGVTPTIFHFFQRLSNIRAASTPRTSSSTNSPLPMDPSSTSKIELPTAENNIPQALIQPEVSTSRKHVSPSKSAERISSNPVKAQPPPPSKRSRVSSEESDDDDDDDEDVYDVERIIAYRVRGGEEFYLLKWVGWSYSDCTWIRKTDMNNCNAFIDFFDHRVRVANKIYEQCLEKSIDVPNYPYHIDRSMRNAPDLILLAIWEDAMNKVCRAAGVAPIFVENWIDDDIFPPENFVFAQGTVFHKSAKKLLKPSKFRSGCGCTKNKHCGIAQCCSAAAGYRFPYRNNKLDNDEDPIIECSPNCGCDLNCPSRLVQRGRQIPIVLFKTKDCGWSVRTAVYIPRGTFVMAYIGEVIDKNLQRVDTRYLYDIDCVDETTFTVDSLNYGNEARYVNHSCSPNMRTYGVVTDRYHNYETLAFFAVKDIKVGDELTIDYNAQLGKKEVVIGGSECYCGAKRCRGSLL